MQIGWVGLGEIGMHMARRALAAGHELIAYDRGAGKAEVAAAGGQLSGDYREVARDADVVGLCLFSDAQVRDVMFDQGMLAAMKPGAVLAVHTTGSPVLARELGERAPAGVAVLDACFSGSADDTVRGDLTLMLGGEADALDAARPLLSSYASRINHMGPLGTGQTAKLLNNLLFATNIMQAAQVVAMAEALGLDPKHAASVISQSSGASMAMGLFSTMAPEQLLAAASHYMVKDVEAAAAAAQDAGLDIATFQPIIAYFRRGM
jgi:3-hydroxyisobutyrate dehydrogenase